MSENQADLNNFYENLPDNSHKAREERKQAANKPSEEKRATKVVRGKVKAKKNDGRKLASIFISEDASNIKNYVLFDVVVPAIKKAIYELVVGTLDMSLYGGRGRGQRPTADKISFRDYSEISRKDERNYGCSKTASGYTYDDIVVETRGEAEAVLSRMDEIMEEYKIVRVADLYDLVGITGNYTDNNYGWTNIINAGIVRVRDGYKIKMPRAIPLR